MATDEVQASKERRRPKGKAIDRSAEEIAELSTIQDSDVQAARDDWKEKATPKYRGLIDAEKE